MLENATIGDRAIKRLRKDALKCFNKHLEDIKKLKADVRHLNSRIQDTAARKDSMHFIAHGYCGFFNCSIKYKFYKKEVSFNFITLY